MADKALPSPEVLRQLLRYDPETGKLFWRTRFAANHAERRAVATFNTRRDGREAIASVNGEGYAAGVILQHPVKAHRVAWAIHFGSWPDGIIDHIDGDRLNNALKNLRVVSSIGNSRNAAMRRDSTNIHPGVNKRGNKWQATIGANGREYLGRFDTPAEAVLARKKAEARLGYHQNHARKSELTPIWRE